MVKTEVTIYTDGACSGNPGPGGYAAIIMKDGNSKEIVGAKKDTTNNQMELMAAIEGLKALKVPCKVLLYSDSAYLVNAYEKGWINTWKKSGWKTASKTDVKNVDLWLELEKLRDIHDITFIKVKGHADNEYNNKCDKLAVEAITKLQNGELQEQKQDEDKVKEVFGSLPQLETQRLKIRLFKREDANDLYEYCSDEEVTKYIYFPKYNSIADAEKRIEKCLKSYETLEKPIPWAIEYKEDKKLIGSIDFVTWDIENNIAEVEYAINSKYWNKGIMTEALKAVIKFGFEKMDLNRIELYCDERNIASARVMEKNGLKLEGVLRAKKFVKGECINLKVYSILKDEYIN